MKSVSYLFVPFALAIILFSCKQDNTKSDAPPETISTTTTTEETSTTKELWAEQVESSINLTVPEDWAPDDWNAIFKNINRKKIYADIVDAVLSGKQTAYHFLSNEAYTIDQIKTMLSQTDTLSVEDPATKKIEKKVVNKISSDKISLIRVREKVYFDKENFKLMQIPTALILYINHNSDDGTFVGYQALFYVKIK